jgi:chloramphenicol 3-O phosphotransferase
MTGKIILLNGASSSGKSTLARALQDKLEEPFWHYSIDHLIAAKILPSARVKQGDFVWSEMRPAFFEGFHHALPAFAEAGNNLIVEHIVETSEWMMRLLHLLRHLDVFFVGVHCPLPELERRERERGDRKIGEAKADYEITHTFCTYDFEVDSTEPLEHTVNKVIAAWKVRQQPSVFKKMISSHDKTL